MIAHVGTITGRALEAPTGHEMLIGWTSVSYIRTLAVDAVYEELNCPHMIAGK